MKRRYLKDVTTLPDYLSLADKNVWSSVVTNGIFVRFGDVELSHDEILSMAEQEH